MDQQPIVCTNGIRIKRKHQPFLPSIQRWARNATGGGLVIDRVSSRIVSSGIGTQESVPVSISNLQLPISSF